MDDDQPSGQDVTQPSDPVRRCWRTRTVVAIVGVVWIVLAARLVQLQWWQTEHLAGLANRQSTHEEFVPARPGDVVDRHGRLLATTITCQSLFVDAGRLDDVEATAEMLGRTLDIDPEKLFQRISGHRDKRFLWIKRRLDAGEAAGVRELSLPRNVWGFREEFLRRYPQGRLAAHVVGLRDIDGVGRGGIEQQFDQFLKGLPGRRVLVKDALGRVINVWEQPADAPRNGGTLVLTLDSVIQLYAEQELEALFEQCHPRSACALVLEPKSGELLAVASRPTFDPNNPGNALPDVWKNIAIEAAFEPGSTFKPFVVAWALDRGRLHTQETLYCENGLYRMGGRLLHDLHSYGTLDVADVLVKSSNIGMAKIGERIGNEGLYEAAVTFGFGHKTGIELPGEISGILRPLAEWTRYSTGSVPMGQEVAVTPLQLIAAYGALANGGRFISPHLVLRYDGQGAARPVNVVSRAVAPDVAEWLVRKAMRDVVLRGTGGRASLDDYSVFGKTGTAEKRRRVNGDGVPLRHTCWFVCGAPVENPRLLVLVVADEPASGPSHYGGVVAAPCASRLLQKALVHLGVPSVASSSAPPRMQ